METIPKNPLPLPLGDDAHHGIVGEIVRKVSPHSEADPAAILMHVLAASGNVIGRGAWFGVGGQRHHGNLFIAIVGKTSSGRKGTAYADSMFAFHGVDEAWTNDRQLGGLSSGEGLIWAVRDPVQGYERDKKTKELIPVTIDPGVSDKRLFIIESEFATVLRRMGRESNTLSMVMRQAWDGGKLNTMTKSCPATATEAHVSCIAHVTADELRREMADAETYNGFGNRLLWCCSQRSKLLPDGGNLGNESFDSIRDEIRHAIEYATPTVLGCVKRDAEAGELWRHVYGDLTAETPGTFGAMTARGAAQVVRLSLIYAVLDRSALIRVDHLRAGLEVWRYCRESAAWLFGPTESVEDRERRELLQWIANKGGRVSPRDLQRNLRRYADDPDRAEADLTAMVDAGMGAWEIMPAKGNGSRVTRLFCLADSPNFSPDGSADTDKPIKIREKTGGLSASAVSANGNHTPKGRVEL
jgi:hypothetical protein